MIVQNLQEHRDIIDSLMAGGAYQTQWEDGMLVDD